MVEAADADLRARLRVLESSTGSVQALSRHCQLLAASGARRGGLCAARQAAAWLCAVAAAPGEGALALIYLANDVLQATLVGAPATHAELAAAFGRVLPLACAFVGARALAVAPKVRRVLGLWHERGTVSAAHAAAAAAALDDPDTLTSGDAESEAAAAAAPLLREAEAAEAAAYAAEASSHSAHVPEPDLYLPYALAAAAAQQQQIQPPRLPLPPAPVQHWPAKLPPAALPPQTPASPLTAMTTELSAAEEAVRAVADACAVSAALPPLPLARPPDARARAALEACAASSSSEAALCARALELSEAAHAAEAAAVLSRDGLAAASALAATGAGGAFVLEDRAAARVAGGAEALRRESLPVPAHALADAADAAMRAGVAVRKELASMEALVATYTALLEAECAHLAYEDSSADGAASAAGVSAAGEALPAYRPATELVAAQALDSAQVRVVKGHLDVVRSLRLAAERSAEDAAAAAARPPERGTPPLPEGETGASGGANLEVADADDEEETGLAFVSAADLFGTDDGSGRPSAAVPASVPPPPTAAAPARVNAALSAAQEILMRAVAAGHADAEQAEHEMLAAQQEAAAAGSAGAGAHVTAWRHALGAAHVAPVPQSSFAMQPPPVLSLQPPQQQLLQHQYHQQQQQQQLQHQPFYGQQSAPQQAYGQSYSQAPPPLASQHQQQAWGSLPQPPMVGGGGPPSFRDYLMPDGTPPPQYASGLSSSGGYIGGSAQRRGVPMDAPAPRAVYGASTMGPRPPRGYGRAPPRQQQW